MREILFRGKELKTGNWYFGYIQKKRVIGGVNWLLHEDLRASTAYHRPIIVDAETVGQFTGLSDKKGTKIFEGDIVRLISDFEDYSITYMGVIHIGKHDFGNPTNYGCYVEWHYSREKDYLRENLLFWIDENLDPFEVIGNIYDNPELLEVKDNV